MLTETPNPPVLTGATQKTGPRIVRWVLVILTLVLVVLFWIYGTETHHSNRNSIWWSDRGRGLIPPEANGISLRQDILDHYAIYTISESNLNSFIDTRFTRPGEKLNSFKERTPVRSEDIGKTIGPFNWVLSNDCVIYNYTASNGGSHTYIHNTRTGLTYQISQYW